jgi:pimeloyl-ACP methyl ester carboxylesterase
MVPHGVTTVDLRGASRFIAIDDLTLHYLDFGGHGTPLVFLHATGFHSWIWLPYVHRFVSRYHVMSLDQRGHGKSDKPQTGYRWEVFGADLVGFLDALGLEDALAVGHSKGGTAIAAAAAAGTGRLSRAVLIEPVLFPAPSALEPVWESPLAIGARRRRQVWPTREAMFELLRERLPFATWAEEFVRLYVDHGVADRPDGQVALRCPGDVEAQVYAHAPLSDSFAFLEHLEIPTLLVRGQNSPGLGQTEAAEALRRLPDGTLLTIPQCGHFVPMERPVEVADALLRFFQPPVRR